MATDIQGQHQPTSLTSLLISVFAQAAAPPHIDPAISSSSSSSSSSFPLQDPASHLLTLIERCNTLANSLGLFSDNDSLEDLPTSTIRALLIHSVWAEVESNQRTRGDLRARRNHLLSSKSHYITFIRILFDLNILPKTGSASTGSSPFHLLASLLRPLSTTLPSTDSITASLPSDLHQRRELKVSLFKLERAFKAALDEYRHAARAKAGLGQGGALSVPGAGTSTGSSSSVDLTAPDEAQWDLLVLPRRKGRGEGGDDEDEDEEDADASAFVSGTGRSDRSSQQQQQQQQQQTNGGAKSAVTVSPPTSLRAYLLMLLQLHALLAFNNLVAMEDEIKLLNNIPASAARDALERQAREEAEMERTRGGSGSDDFRLERRFDASTPGPLMDEKGKPLRPFTITASNRNSKGSSANGQFMGGAPVHDLDERQRIREGVFQPGHRLPTMSIDEYLEEEQRRGNIIQGGGAAGAAQPTPRESRALRMENDGTLEAQEAEEEARREAIQWDEFKESNKRGAGNTMNRG